MVMRVEVDRDRQGGKKKEEVEGLRDEGPAVGVDHLG
jgi:hypothetical protein